MIEKLLNDYLPATLTFIVGMLSILSQLTINFFSERNKHRLELKKTKKENIYQYYLPLLALAREYKDYHDIVSLCDFFQLSNWNYPNSPDTKIQYDLLKKTYNDLEALSKGHYIPTKKKLNEEIQQFNKHIILINCLWRGQCQDELFREIIPSNEQRGYDVTSLIAQLEAIVAKS